MTLIKDIVTKDDMFVEAASSLEYAIKTMAKNMQGVVVVVDKLQPIGILTERDLVNLIRDDLDFTLLVSELSKKHIVSVNHNRTIEYALHILIDNNIRRLVVVNDENKFIGVVTQDTLIKYIEEESFKINLVVSQVISPNRNIISISNKNNIRKALKVMNKYNIGSVLVVGHDSNPVGIFTERDIIKIAHKHISLETNISEVMSMPVITVGINDKVKSVANLMYEKKIRRVLVIDKNKYPVGVIGTRDIAYNLKGNYGQFLESKLKNIKNTLNYIGESVLEIYDDNNSQIIQWANETALKHFTKKIIDKPITFLINQEAWEEIYQQSKREGKCEKYRIVIEDMYFEVMCSYHYSSNKETILIILKDVSEFEKAVISEVTKREKIEKELSLLQNVIDQQNSIVIVTDGKKIKQANKTFLDFYQVESVEAFDKEFGCLSDTFISHSDFFSSKKDNSGSCGTGWINEILEVEEKNRLISIVDIATVEPKAFSVQVNKLSDYAGFYVVTLTDITDIKLESQQHYYHATHDVLTGLYNRAYYFDRLDNEIVNAVRYRRCFSIILFDIDHFKKFNDTYGHLKGDEVLKAVAKATSINTRKNDTISRWGGEEFIVLLPDTKLNTAELIAENLRKIIQNLKVEGVSQITASFGVSEYKQNDDENALLQRADEALYEAKESGRNKVASKA